VAKTIGARSVLASALRTRASLLERRGATGEALAARERAAELATAIGMHWEG
jgi:hypothetical protein